MRPAPNEKLEKRRVRDGPEASTKRSGNNGMFRIVLPHPGRWPKKWHFLTVIASDGLGWDHVSVSHISRTPTWFEMERVRELFFDDDETVVQFSVPRELHIDIHRYCLHMWRKQSSEFELPPEWMI